MRELRQSARLKRTPIILAVVTGMITLLISSIGGLASVQAQPAKVGLALFHTFFSVAFAVVTWVGPAVAASTIASERSGRTWEALLLTGLGAPSIARGKFLSAFTYISLYIVMLAPVGALPFLFGGISAAEVLAAFALLFLFAALSVASGLALGSKFASQAAAVIVTPMVTISLSLLIYVLMGPLLSIVVHDLWPSVPAGPPVWLPTAYFRADFGLEYVAFLILSPIACIALPAWFLYEVTNANLAGPSDDRSSGLRVWFLISTPIIALTLLATAGVVGDKEAFAIVLAVLFAFLLFAAFLFAGEPLGPSERVKVHWERQRQSRVRRFLGPGIMEASVLQAALGLGSIALLIVGALMSLGYTSGPASKKDFAAIVAFGLYGAAFALFLVGLSAWLRSRATSGTTPRLLMLGTLFFASVGPWIAMAVTGVLAEKGFEAIVLTAPSPTYAVVMLDAVGTPGARGQLIAGAVCAAAWAFLGAGLLAAAGQRVRRRLREHEATIAQVNALLTAEEAASSPEINAAPETAN